MEKDIKIIASEKTWIEGAAVRQLQKTAQAPAIIAARGMPDLHPGKGVPIGSAFLSREELYPHLAGNDIGCGMALFKTGHTKAKKEKWVKKLEKFRPSRPEEEHTKEFTLFPSFNGALGSVGMGNHFAELQVFERICDIELFDRLPVTEKDVMLLIHSGSRGLGSFVLEKHLFQNGAAALAAGSDAAREYMENHNYALRWARKNRELIARNIDAHIGGKSEKICDTCHNSIEKILIENRDYWLHRKGAASATESPVTAIPGSRGSFTYLVAPTGEQKDNLWSLAHGAGRKWQRSSCKGRLVNKHTLSSLKQTKLKSHVICRNKELLYEEAPEAYKNIEQVIEDMVNAGMIRVIAVLKPLITLKPESKQW